MAERVVAALLRLTGSEPGAADAQGARETIQSAKATEWEGAAVALTLHRIEPLAWYVLNLHGLTDALPQAMRAHLQDAHRNTLLRNMSLIHAWGEAIDAFAREGVHPTFWKGIVLATGYYPDLGMRYMEDIDIAIRESELAGATKALEGLGYQAVARSEDAVDFQHANGIAFDVHHRVRLFEGHEPDTLVRVTTCPQLAGRTYQSLNPNAMLALLISHADGHHDGMGFVLRWMLDVHFFLAAEGDAPDVDRLRELLPQGAPTVLLLRLLHFLEDSLGTPIPECLRPAMGNVPPLTLEEVTRSRRWALWGLPAPLGFARWLARRYDMANGQRRPALKPGDLWKAVFRAPTTPTIQVKL